MASYLLPYVFGLSTYDFINTFYVALFDDGATEFTNSEYARIGIPNNDSNWELVEDDDTITIRNKNAISWPAAESNWGTLGQIDLCAAGVKGVSDSIFSKVLDVGDQLSVVTGKNVVIPAQGITLGIPGNVSRYMLNILEGIFLEGDSYSESSFYVGVFLTMPTIDTDGVEVGNVDYARQEFPCNGTYWFDAGGYIYNNARVNIVAQSMWGMPVGWGIWDAATEGNLLFFGDIAVEDQKVYYAGDIFVINKYGMEIIG